MRKKFTMLLASLFLVMGTAWAQNVVTSTEDAPVYYTIASYNRGGVFTYANVGDAVQHADYNTNGNSTWYFEAVPDNANNGVYIVSKNKSDGKKVYLGSDKKASTTAAVWYILPNGVNDYGFCISKNTTTGGSACIDAGNNKALGNWSPDKDDWQGTTWLFLGDVTNATYNPNGWTKQDGTGGRKISSITINGTTHNVGNSDLMYVDQTRNIKFTVAAGAEIAISIDRTGGWMQAFAYVDKAGDGFVTEGVGGDGYTPTGDLVTYSCYSVDDNNKGFDSKGKELNDGARNTVTMPSFVAPTEPGSYRLRINYDWNSLDPNGAKDKINVAGGQFVDVTLMVMDETYTVKYNFVYNNNVKYSQSNSGQCAGEEYPEITVTHPYGVVSAAKPTGVIDANDAVDGVITKEIALSVQGLPFEFSDSYANAVWYYMPLHNSEKNYLSYAESQTYIPLGNDQKVLPADGHDAYLWAFVGDPFTGYKIMNKAAGDAKILSSSTTMTNGDGATYPLMVAEASLPKGYNTYWIPSASSHATNGFFLAQKDNSSNRMNRRDNKLAYWTGGADGGSTFRVTALATDADFENIETMKAFAGKVGYPKSDCNEYTALAAWVKGRTTKLDAEVAISNFKKSSNIVLPADGKAYTFTAVMGDAADATKYYMKYENGKKVAVSTTVGDASVFVCKELRAGVYAFITEDGKILTWIGNDESGAYKENNNIYGYSSYYATVYNDMSDWNDITVKKNGTVEKDFGHLRLVARRKKDGISAIIANNNNRFDQAGDNYFFDKSNSSAWILTEVKHTNTDVQNLALARVGAKNTIGNRIFGEGIGKYHYVKDEQNVYTLNIDEATIDEINAAVATIAINQPATGFYRVKSMNGNDAAKKGKYWQVNSDETEMELNATAHDYNSILYVADNTILSYGSGLYVNNYNNPAAIGTEARTWVISENNAITGTYALYQRKDDGTVDGYCLSDWEGLTYGQNDANAAWIFEEAVSLPVAVSAAGYATFIAPVAVTIPEGVEAYTGVVTGNYLVLTPVTETIPANTGVVLKAAENTYNFKIVADVDRIPSHLVGSTAAKANDKQNEKEIPYYTLQKPGDEVVFMQYNGDVLAGSKAYLDFTANPTSAKSISIRFEGSTDIENVEIRNEKSEMIFDLLGRRVEAITKGGIYIVNGKKVVVK